MLSCPVQPVFTPFRKVGDMDFEETRYQFNMYIYEGVNSILLTWGDSFLHP